MSERTSLRAKTSRAKPNSKIFTAKRREVLTVRHCIVTTAKSRDLANARRDDERYIKRSEEYEREEERPNPPSVVQRGETTRAQLTSTWTSTVEPAGDAEVSNALIELFVSLSPRLVARR